MNRESKGYITLGNVITVGSMALAVAISLLIIGINSYESTYMIEKSAVAQSLSDTCGEIALNNIRLDNGYTGNETHNIDANTCKIETVITNPDSTITINTSGTVQDTTRKTQIIISGFSPALQIEAWREVADF